MRHHEQIRWFCQLRLTLYWNTGAFSDSFHIGEGYPYQIAQKLDKITSQAILNLDVNTIDSQHACGCVGIRGLLTFVQRHPLKASLLDLRNSGDTVGSKDGVVGYGAYLFTEET